MNEMKTALDNVDADLQLPVNVGRSECLQNCMGERLGGMPVC